MNTDINGNKNRKLKKSPGVNPLVSALSLGLIGVSALLVSCTTQQTPSQSVTQTSSQTSTSSVQSPALLSTTPSTIGTNYPLTDAASREQSGAVTSTAADRDVPLKEVFRGTGSFINSGSAARTGPADSEGEVTLNFQGSPIPEVVKTVLGDILGLNYAINDAVSGTISMRTTRPIARDALVPVLDNLLRMNGAALIKSQDFYEVVHTDDARVAGLTPSLRLSSDKGYQVLIVPLRYVGAKEMVRILETVKSGKATVMADEFRNILTIAGSHGELFNLRETISIFDVNQLKGMSVGLFRLEHVEVGTLLAELETIFGDNANGPLAGLVRFMPMDRLNAIMVITQQEKYLRDVEVWIDRLDQAENPHGMNMYVYYVQNGKAEHLADMLTQLFEGRRRNALASAQRESASAAPVAASGDGGGDGAGAAPTRGSGGGDRTSIDIGDVSIIPDIENNALVVLATPIDYAEIEKAVTKLDIPPMQVLVEASIIEVTLGNELEYGLQWFFRDNHGRFNGTGGLNIPSNGVVSSLAGTISPADFTYAIFDAAGTRAVLNAVAGDSRINVLSSPSLMVLDNQTASIRVGDQVPIRTSETNNTSSGSFDDEGNFGSNITSRIQYRDTGVSLEVTPRVNAGGMVIMEITQRVDDVDETTTSDIDSPTILQREINTNVAVQSGETIVLGGLIREDKETSDSGIPFLKDIPGIGMLFGGKRIANTKTELIVMITPSAVGNPQDARRVTEEYKDKLKGVDFSDMK